MSRKSRSKIKSGARRLQRARSQLKTLPEHSLKQESQQTTKI